MARRSEPNHAADGLGGCDGGANDALPSALRTAAGAMPARPLPPELEDRCTVGENAGAEYADQVIDARGFLLEDARHAGQGRVLALNIFRG